MSSIACVCYICVCLFHVIIRQYDNSFSTSYIILHINLRMNHIHVILTEGLTPIDFKLLQLFSIVVMTDLIKKFPNMANVYGYFCGMFSEACLYGIDGVIPAPNPCSLWQVLANGLQVL